MNDVSEILKIDATFDLKVEAFATALLKQTEALSEAYSLEQLVIFPNGSIKQRSSYEVSEVRKKEYDRDVALFIEVNRKGLYDHLPERLFLRLDEGYESLIHKARAIEQQIKGARKFLLPFDQAMLTPRVKMEQVEQEWNEHFPGFITLIWDLNKYSELLNKRQTFLLLYLIPEAFRVTGNWELTEVFFAAVLQKQVKIHLEAATNCVLSDNSNIQYLIDLGELNAYIGDHFRDEIPSLVVTIYGININELNDYLPFGSQRLILEEILYSYFIPMEIIPITRIEVTVDSWGFDLGTSVLGFCAEFN